MPTGLERRAAKARQEPKLRFTRLAPPIDPERGWQNLCRLSPPTADELKQDVAAWSEATLRALHPQGASCAREGCPAAATADSRAAGPTCGRPARSRTVCRARSGVDRA
jgi:hypothetical protein